MDNGSRIRDSKDIMWQELLKPEWCPHLDSWFCTRFSCHGCSPSFNSSYIVSRWRWAIEWGRGDYILSSMCTVVLFNAVIVTRWTHDSMTWACVNDLGYRSLVCSWSAYLPRSSATPFPNYTSNSCIFLEKITCSIGHFYNLMKQNLDQS